MIAFSIDDSLAFPGTHRSGQIYIPDAIRGVTGPVGVMVFNDGHAYAAADGWFRTPSVLDALIRAGDVPPLVAVFVNPGHTGSDLPNSPWNASNRSVEYDSLSPTYAAFLEQDVLPRVAQHAELSDDPRRRAIAGFSSGGICAFTVAWERPDLFANVMSHSGSFANIRGGHTYPYRVRQSPRKPIRVFLQCGTNDVNNEIGHWHLCNQQMAAALSYRDYDVRFVSDDGVHDGVTGGAILAESLRWLWR